MTLMMSAEELMTGGFLGWEEEQQQQQKEVVGRGDCHLVPVVVAPEWMAEDLVSSHDTIIIT